MDFSQISTQVLQFLQIPSYGLGSLFVISFLSATLLPLGSEPALIGLLQIRPDLFWQAIAAATLGNTLGGVFSYSMGYGVFKIAGRLNKNATQKRAAKWLHRFGPKVCLLSWLPIIGDPLCAVAGWLKLDFWPCVFYILLGKFMRYLLLTLSLQWGWQTFIG